MKLKKLLAQIKKDGKKVYYFTDFHGTQWIGNSSAIYPLPNMPIIDGHQILTLLDIPLENHESYYVAALNDSSRLDEHIRTLTISDYTIYDGNHFRLKCGTKEYIVLNSTDGIKFIDSADMDVMDLIDDYCTIYYKYIDGMIIFTNGLIVAGMISCRDIISKEMVNMQKRIYDALNAAWQQSQERLEIKEAEIDQINFETLDNIK